MPHSTFTVMQEVIISMRLATRNPDAAHAHMAYACEQLILWSGCDKMHVVERLVGFLERPSPFPTTVLDEEQAEGDE